MSKPSQNDKAKPSITKPACDDPGEAKSELLIQPCELCNGKASGKNIILCFDGTSNQFGQNNTNVVELYSRIIKNDSQVTYYNSGIGTYARPSWRSIKYLKQVWNNKIDLAIAWNFEKNVLAGYRWLSATYKPGDKIFLFGYSRGAYQVRALAGMIGKVGLILPGNEEQIPFAYELFADLGKPPRVHHKRDSHCEEWPDSRPKNTNVKTDNSAKKPADEARDEAKQPADGVQGNSGKKDGGMDVAMAKRFKKTFSRPDVKVHFLGLWDTVSSVGIIRDKNLPYTDEFDDEHICYFRHALALDERRVKFLPEYVCGGQSYREDPAQASKKEGPALKLANTEPTAVDGKKTSTFDRVKEVWFAGCHSDIGGGNQPNEEMNNAAVPVLWMGNEAWLAGLKLEASKFEWHWDKLKYHKPRESLTFVWRLFEVLPFKRLSYRDERQVTWWPHMGRGRWIQRGQKIHASVAFIQDYEPLAKFSEDIEKGDWLRILCKGRQDRFEWLEGIEELLELDLFDHTRINQLIEAIGTDINNDEIDEKKIQRLNIWASRAEGLRAILTASADFSLFIKMVGNSGASINEIGKRIILGLLTAAYVPELKQRKDCGEMIASFFRTIKRAHDNIGHEASEALYKLVQDDNVKNAIARTTSFSTDFFFIILENDRYGVFIIAELCTSDEIVNSITEDVLEIYVSALDTLKPWNRSVGLAAIVSLRKHADGQATILNSKIVNGFVDYIKDGSLLWNEYNAEIACRMFEYASASGTLDVGKVIGAIFDAIKNQPFAIDVFSWLLQRSVPENVTANLFEKVLEKCKQESADSLCGYLQALGQLAPYQSDIVQQKVVAQFIESLKEHKISPDHRMKLCLSYAHCCLATNGSMRSTNTSQPPPDLTREFQESIAQLDKLWQQRGTRWLEQLLESAKCSKLKDVLTPSDKSPPQAPAKSEIDRNRTRRKLFEKHIRGEELERYHYVHDDDVSELRNAIRSCS